MALYGAPEWAPALMKERRSKRLVDQRTVNLRTLRIYRTVSTVAASVLRAVKLKKAYDARVSARRRESNGEPYGAGHSVGVEEMNGVKA